MFITVNKQLKVLRISAAFYLGFAKEKFKKDCFLVSDVSMDKVMILCLSCYTEMSRPVPDAVDVQTLIVPLKAGLLNFSAMLQTETLFSWCKNCTGANERVTLLFALESPALVSACSITLNFPAFWDVMLCLWVRSSRRFERSQCVRVRNRNVGRCTPTTRKQQRCDSRQVSHLSCGKNVNWVY